MSALAILKCALTGPLATKRDNPNLPTTGEEIARSAREAPAAGAAVVHTHVCDGQERPTFANRPPDFRADPRIL